MSKYHAIGGHLAIAKTERKRMSFDDIEAVLGFSLPQSARKFPAWWANDPNPSRHSCSWLSAGWTTAEVDIPGEKVTFVRGGNSQRAPVRQSENVQPPRRPRTSTVTLGTLNDAPDGAVNLAIDLRWKRLGPVVFDSSKGIEFPSAPKVPALYRLRLITANGERYYVGETVNLSRRFRNYRNPGSTQKTSLRINATLREHLAAGECIEIDIIIDRAGLKIGGRSVAIDLADKATRRLLENAALVAHGATDIECLNR